MWKKKKTELENPGFAIKYLIQAKIISGWNHQMKGWWTLPGRIQLANADSLIDLSLTESEIIWLYMPPNVKQTELGSTT